MKVRRGHKKSTNTRRIPCIKCEGVPGENCSNCNGCGYIEAWDLPDDVDPQDLPQTISEMKDGARLVADQDNWPTPEHPSASTIQRDVEGILGITERKTRRRKSWNPGEVDLSPDDEDSYRLVAEARDGTKTNEERDEYLRRMLYDGDDQSTEVAVGEALNRYESVDQGLSSRRIKAKLRKSRRVSPPGAKFARSMIRARARESGFSYEEVTASVQGLRNSRHDPVKNIREELVFELRKMGVAQRVIAELLNVSQPRVSEIESEQPNDREILPVSESPEEWNKTINAARVALDQYWSDEETPSHADSRGAIDTPRKPPL